MTTPAAAKLEQNLAASGFLLLGGFAPDGAVAVPPLAGGKQARSLLLIGSTGPSIWPHLTASPEYKMATRILSTDIRGAAFGPCRDIRLRTGVSLRRPAYYPFQQWAMKCGGFLPKPLGVLTHRTFGPWAGFRAAF